MIAGHRCKVKSNKAVHVTKEHYTHFYDIVSCYEFKKAMDTARNQLQSGLEDTAPRVYQKEFVLPMKRNLFGLLTISVLINHEEFQFIIDTGAQISGIKERVAKKLKLQQTQGSVTIGSIGGTHKSMPGVFADTFALGAIEYHHFPMITLDEQNFSLRFGNIDLFSFDGILGWDVLSQFDFEIDDIKKCFKILQNKLKVPYPNMIKGSFPCFIVHLPNGGQALYGFDSGSKLSWIGENTIETHGYSIASETTSIGFGVHGMEKLPMKIVEHVQLFLDKAQIDLQHTMTGRTDIFPSFSFDGVLGNEICKGRRMRIINSACMVLIA